MMPYSDPVAERIATALEKIAEQLQARNEMVNTCEGAQAEALVGILDLLQVRKDPIKAVCYPSNLLDKDFEYFFGRDFSVRGINVLRMLKEFEGINTPRDLLKFGRRKYCKTRQVGPQRLNEMDVFMESLFVGDLWLNS